MVLHVTWSWSQIRDASRCFLSRIPKDIECRKRRDRGVLGEELRFDPHVGAVCVSLACVHAERSLRELVWGCRKRDSRGEKGTFFGSPSRWVEAMST